MNDTGIIFLVAGSSSGMDGLKQLLVYNNQVKLMGTLKKIMQNY